MCHSINYLCSGEDLRLGVQANHAEVLHVVGFPLRYLRCFSNEPIRSSSMIASSLAVLTLRETTFPGSTVPKGFRYSRQNRLRCLSLHRIG